MTDPSDLRDSSDPTPSHDEARRNRLLAALPEADLSALLEGAALVDLERRNLLHEQDEPIREVYFPLDAVVSLLVGVEGSEHGVECATVGQEGIVGLPVFLGAASLNMRAVVQVSGQGIRLSAERLRRLLVESDGPLQILLQRYTQTIITALAQNVACDRMHPVRPRAARWLLTTADRVGRESFDLTQDFLAQMLGVRRATVTEAAGALAEAGAISYRRGEITVTDRAKLEAEACSCYAAVRDMLDRMLVGPDVASSETRPDGPQKGVVPDLR